MNTSMNTFTVAVTPRIAAWLVMDSLGRRLCHDQRLRDATARDCRAVCLDREADPGAGHHRFLPQEVCARNGKIEHFHDREDDDQRGYHDRHGRAGADRAADRDRGGHAADRNAGSERRRPFAAEAEPFPGDEINHRPIDQIGLDDRRNAAQHQRRRERQFAGGRHGQERAEDHDRDLDVEFGPDRLIEPCRRGAERNWRSTKPTKSATT